MNLIRKLQQRYRYSIILLGQLVKTNFKLRYQGSILGYLWSLLKPLLIFCILYFVFTRFLTVGNGVEHYPVYLLLGIVLWNFFGEITGGSVGAIVDKGDLIRKINFPKYNIVLAIALSAVINLAFNFVVIGIFMFFGRVPLHWSALLVIPLVGELFLVAIALAFLLSALYVRFRDVTYIWEVLMQAGFYVTPIIYPMTKVGSGLLSKVILLNPVAQILQDARYAMVTKQSITLGHVFGGNVLIYGVPFGVAMVLLALGGLYFRAHSRTFAEEV